MEKLSSISTKSTAEQFSDPIQSVLSCGLDREKRDGAVRCQLVFQIVKNGRFADFFSSERPNFSKYSTNSGNYLYPSSNPCK